MPRCDALLCDVSQFGLLEPPHTTGQLDEPPLDLKLDFMQGYMLVKDFVKIDAPGNDQLQVPVRLIASS